MVSLNFIKRRFERRLQWLVVLAILFAVSFQTRAQNIIQIMDASVAAGGQVTISINISNADPFVGFQLDIPLPVNTTYVANSTILDATRSNGHSISASILSGNLLRIIAFSINNTPFNGNTGTVATFELNAGNIPGDYALNIQNSIIAHASLGNILTGIINGTLTIQASDIQVSPDSQDFGSIPLGGNSDRSFTLQNTGNQTLSVSLIDIDNIYFENLGNSSLTLSPGQSTAVNIRFNAVVKGTYANTMSFHSNDPDQPVVTVDLEAIAFAVNELHTGDMEAASGTQSDLSFSINNMEDFVGFQFDLNLPSPLTYVSESGFLSSDRITDHQLSVSMINSTTLRVIGLSPTNTPFAGDDGTIITLGFDINGAGGWYPLDISNVIIGDANGDNVVSAYTNGSLNITAPDIDANTNLGFGDVAVNATSNQSLTIYNYGQEILTIDAITFTNSAYSNASSLPLVVPSNQSGELSVHFDPEITGQNQATMRIFSDDPDENPFNVSLTANVFSPNYMTAANLTSEADTTVWFEISVENYDEFVGFQVDVVLPSGITYVNGSAFLNEDRSQDHMLSVTSLDNGGVRLLAFSFEQMPFLENDGTVVSIALLIAAGVEEGNYPLILEHALLGNSNSENILYGINNGEITIEIIPEYHNLEILLGQGYTWFSVNVNPGSLYLNDLFDNLEPCYNDRVIGQTSFALFTGSAWAGSLNQLDMNRMYVMRLCSPQVLTLNGMQAPIDPIQLSAGYTWIGHLPQYCMPINDALANLNPSPSYNDRLIAQNSFALYNGSEWVGTLNTLCPGVGYVIRLANASTLSYEQVRGSEGMENIQLSEKVESPIGIQPNSNMLYSMTVVAKLALDNDALLVSEKDMVYAYINGEVSGMMHPSQGEEGLIFLSIGSNFESSEEITFKLWLDGQQQLLPLHESLTYEPFAAIGEPSSPFYLTLKDMAGQEEQSNGFWIGEPYPNPFKGQTTVPYYLNEGSEISYKIYDSRGVQVVPAKSITATKGHQHFTIESVGLAQGVYLLEVTLSNHSKMIRLVIN